MVRRAGYAGENVLFGFLDFSFFFLPFFGSSSSSFAHLLIMGIFFIFPSPWQPDFVSVLFHRSYALKELARPNEFSKKGFRSLAKFRKVNRQFKQKSKFLFVFDSRLVSGCACKLPLFPDRVSFEFETRQEGRCKVEESG